MSLGDVVERVEIGQQLRATERIEAITDGAAAAGLMKARARRSHFRALQITARGRRSMPDEARTPAAPKTREAALAEIAAFGIEVVKESAAAKETGAGG